MSQSFRFEQVFTPDVHDALWDWAQTSYGASDDWCILYLNGLPLGRLNPLWRERLGQDWTGRQSILSDGLNLETDSWAQMGDSLQTLAQQWRECGWLKGWRGEKFDICDPSGKPLCALERAAFRPFGLMSQAVHLNGLVETEDSLRFWIGRRSPHKAVDPNKLDNLTGGGISSGERPSEAVCREGEEEAGIPASMTPHIRPTAQIYSLRPVNRGVHNEILYIFDIVLPEGFQPANQDGEVAGFELMDIPTLLDAMLGGHMMHDAQLVTIEACRRYGLIDPKHPLSAWLDSILCRPHF